MENKKIYKIFGIVGILFVLEYGIVFEEFYKKVDIVFYYVKSKGKDKYVFYNDCIY